MVKWFTEIAPIRTKFSVLLVVNTTIAAAAVGASFALLNGWLSPVVMFGTAIAVLLAQGIVLLMSKKGICDPYVTTVVRMEGLAAGDLTSPIAYTHHTDCARFASPICRANDMQP